MRNIAGGVVLALCIPVGVLLVRGTDDGGAARGLVSGGEDDLHRAKDLVPVRTVPPRSVASTRVPDTSPPVEAIGFHEPAASSPEGTLAIRVVCDDYDVPIPDADVRVAVYGEYDDDLELGVFTAKSDGDGRARVTVPLGSVSAFAHTRDGQYGSTRGRTDPERETELELRLASLVSVSGVVLDEQSKTPLAGALLHNHASSGMGHEGVVTGEDGSFRFPYWSLDSAAALTVQAEGYGTADVCLLVDSERRWARIGESVDFEMQSSEPYIVVELVPDQWIRGQVVGSDGSGVEGARVRVVGTAPSSFFLVADDQAETISGADGLFELSGLRMDVPHLLVCEAPPRGLALRWTPSDVPLLDLGEVVLALPAAVEGTASDARGLPLAGADVRVEIDVPTALSMEEVGALPPGALSHLIGTGRVASDGTFAVDGLVAGRATLVVELGEIEIGVRRLELVEGQRVRVGAVTTEREFTAIEGVLVDFDAAPLSSRTVVLVVADETWARVRTDARGSFAIALPEEDAREELALLLLDEEGRVETRWSSSSGRFASLLRVP